MKSKRFVLNTLLVVAILTLLVFSYSYMNQPRFGYALYAVFSGETTYNTYNTIGFIDAIFFYVVGPVSSELIAFVDRKSTRLNSSHGIGSRMPSSA